MLRTYLLLAMALINLDQGVAIFFLVVMLPCRALALLIFIESSIRYLYPLDKSRNTFLLEVSNKQTAFSWLLATNATLALSNETLSTNDLPICFLIAHGITSDPYEVCDVIVIVRLGSEWQTRIRGKVIRIRIIIVAPLQLRTEKNKY